MPLCFLSAFTKAKSNAITQQEYINHLLSHLRGTRHPEDSIVNLEPLSNFDPWSASLRDIALKSKYDHLSDTSTCETLLTHCITGSLPSFKTTLQHLRNTSPHPSIIEPAACLAAQYQNLDILRYCLDEEDVVFDRHLTRAAQIGARGSMEVLEFLWERDWAGIRGGGDAIVRQILHFGEGSLEAEWLRGRAGKDGNGGEGKEEDGGERKAKAGRKGSKQGYTPDEIQEWFGDVRW